MLHRSSAEVAVVVRSTKAVLKNSFSMKSEFDPRKYCEYCYMFCSN